MNEQKRYRCPECGEMKSDQKGRVCGDCARILTDDAKREMFGDDADFLDDDMGNQ